MLDGHARDFRLFSLRMELGVLLKCCFGSCHFFSSIWITLEVIETALKIDREERNSTTKKMTLKSLLYHVVHIIYNSPLAISFGIQYIDSKLLNEYAEKIRLGGSEPKMEVAEAMVKLIDLIDQAQKQRIKFLSDLRKQAGNEDEQKEGKGDAFLISYYYQDIIWRINILREVQIPRILELVDDRELEQALLNFERISDLYNEHMRLQMQSKDYPIHSERLIHLLNALASIYISIAKKT